MLRFYSHVPALACTTPAPTPPIVEVDLDNPPAPRIVELDLGDPRAPPIVEPDLDNPPADPGLRVPIEDYHPNGREQVRRYYLQKGPCQPVNKTFPFDGIGKGRRRFQSSWFDKYPTWMEYSQEKDVAFCLCCYLFRPHIGKQGGGDSFVGEGFKNWSKAIYKFNLHVGDAHNEAWSMCVNLLNQSQHISTIINKQSDKEKEDYRIRLTASVDCVRFLLQEELAFRGHDESSSSQSKWHFLELLQWLCNHCDKIKAVCLNNAPHNDIMVAPSVQKEVINCCATETVNVIINEIGDSLFSILVDESRDISVKEQMVIVLRYVDKGQVIERFVGIEHVFSTKEISLKEAIDHFFARHGLSISSLRGQGYDGASSMQGEHNGLKTLILKENDTAYFVQHDGASSIQGELNGLKTLILKENDTAYFVHCFAHQLQLALVGLAKNHVEVAGLFCLISKVVNIVGASSKRSDILHYKQHAAIFEAISIGEISTGRGLNQETNLQRSCDTRWSSHLRSLISLRIMFASVLDVLEIITTDGSSSDKKWEARICIDSIHSFGFVFSMHLMKTIMGITNDLPQTLQRKDQDIVNAMKLVSVCKERLQTMRESGWDALLEKVSSFCLKHLIEVPNMDVVHSTQGRPRRNHVAQTNMHHYRVDFFYNVIDMHMQELNARFNETNTELLLCVACLNPCDSFCAFDKDKLNRLALFYPRDFSSVNLVILDDQLDNYIIDMRSTHEFHDLKGISDLARMIVRKRKDKVYPLVYLLITLALLLPVTTATVERVFSHMKIIKNQLRNRMGDEFLNDSMLVHIEKDIFDNIDNEVVIQRFQNMKRRRMEVNKIG